MDKEKTNLYSKGTVGYYIPNRYMWGKLVITLVSKYHYICRTDEGRIVEIFFCDFTTTP